MRKRDDYRTTNEKISDASRSVNKAIRRQQFGQGFYWDYVADFACNFSSSLFGFGLRYLH